MKNGRITFSGFDSDGNHTAILYENVYYRITDSDFISYLQRICAGENRTDASSVATELIPGESYVSWQCLYMTPLSSFAAVGGDSGCQYIVGDNYFVTINRNSGSIVSVTGKPLEGTDAYDVPKWGWQEFPYTDEEWASLYKPDGFGARKGISQLYNEILYQPLTAGKFLLRVDGDLWLVELASNPEMGTYLWSIYSLVPESAMASPSGSMRRCSVPAVRCSVLSLIWTTMRSPLSAQRVIWLTSTASTTPGSSMVVPAGKCLWWSPVNKEGTVVSDADIHFSVHRDGVTTYAGTIYISRDKESNGAYPLYTATIVGTGLHLAQNTENEGGVISAVSTSAVDDEAKKYYLIIGADGVKSIELTMPNSSGGCENADGSLFKKGERIWLENLDGYNDLRGLMITAIVRMAKSSGLHPFLTAKKTKDLPI